MPGLRSNIILLDPRRAGLCAALSFAFAALGCGASKLPEPKVAAEEYLRAAAEGDEDAVYAMMTERAQRNVSREEVKGLLERDEKEFRARRVAFTKDDVKVTGRAMLFLGADQTAALSLENGRFWVESVGLLDSEPRTVEEAILRLKEALAARNFDLLVSTMTDESAKDLVRSLERLEKSLEDLDTAIFDIREDRATIEFSDGRIVKLRRQDEAWKVEEIE